MTEVEENEESSDRKTDEDAESVKKEEKVVSQTEEIQPQAEDGIVVNTSNKTVPLPGLSEDLINRELMQCQNCQQKGLMRFWRKALI